MQLCRPLADCADGLPQRWRVAAQAFFASDTGRALCQHVDARVQQGVAVYPPDPLRALRGLDPAQVRVVILGQDPYHGPGEAEGLAFSVAEGVRIPPSLRNIRKELVADLGLSLPAGGSLLPWVAQGVLLLNTSLTVEDGQPASHARRGWEAWTDAVITQVAEQSPACVFMLWGAHAQAKRGLIEAATAASAASASAGSAGPDRHLLLCSNHPSPLAAARPPVPFVGSRPFSRANAHLRERGVGEVDWRLALA